MLINRRRFLAGASAAGLIRPSRAWTHGSAVVYTRVILIGYGQSNTGVFFTSGVSSPPSANANTYQWNGTSLVTPANVDGVRTLCNLVNNATGLPVIYIVVESPGSGINAGGAFMKGTTAYTSLLSLANSIPQISGPTTTGIQSTDAVFILWDQGEGDTNPNPPENPNIYKTNLTTLRSNLVSDLGRTAANCPWITAGLGISPASDDGSGTPSGGPLASRWWNIQFQQFQAMFEAPGMYFHSNIDFNETDGVHYTGAACALGAQRFAQTINALMGVASGQPWWQISGGSIVDATHTNISLVHSLGTDFTPTSGIDPFEVSGDNGATWISATGARVNATTVQLTHASIATTSVRRARYQYGFFPPGTTGTPGTSNPATASANQIKDNSSIAVPLNPTTWDIQPTPLSSLPVPYYRGAIASVSVDSTHQTITQFPLGPENHQKFLVLALAGGANLSSIMSTFTDNFGNQVGSTGSFTKVADNTGSPEAQIWQCLAPSNTSAATYVNLTLVYSPSAFGTQVGFLWTVPAGDLSSTTATGTNTATVSSATSGSCTVNVSANGFTIALVTQSQQPTAFPTLGGDNTYALREATGSGIFATVGDASACSASATSNFTFSGTFGTTPNLNFVMAAWR